MAEFINFESEEECDEYENDTDDESGDENEENNDFICDDDEIVIPYQNYTPPNPYVKQPVHMPRGMGGVVDSILKRVRSIYLQFLIYFQKRKRSESPIQISSESECEIEKGSPPVKKFRSEPNSRKRKIKSILKKKEPIVISSESESDGSIISISSVEDIDDEPYEKKFRISEDENTVEKFIRDPDEYISMFKTVMKPMKPTKPPVKEPFKVFFPRKREQLLHRLGDDRYGKDARKHVARRLQDLVNNHNRVRKLNSGNTEPLFPEEETTFDVDKMLEVAPKSDPEWMPPPPSQNDQVQTPFDLPPCADFQRPGEDCSERQEKMVAEIRAEEFLVYSTESKKFFRIALNDGIAVPVDDRKHPMEDLRYCQCCDVHIFLGDWMQHLTSYWHQIQLKIRTKLLGFCWYDNKSVAPHQVENCNSCKERTEYLRSKPDLYKWDDFSQYDQATDPEYMQYLDRVKLTSTACATGRFSCIPCGKLNLSKEYYETHLLGKGHKMKMSGKKGSTDNDTGKKAGPDKGGHEKVSTKRKATDESVEEPTVANVPSKRQKVQRQAVELDSCIVKNGDIYSCTLCEVDIKQKRNVNNHLKSKRHQQNSSDKVGVSDEKFTGKGELEEIGFARAKNDGTSRAGRHFLLEFQRPRKYQIGRRLMKFACSCRICLKYFRSGEILSRHKQSKEHKERVKVIQRKRRFWKKPIAGGPKTHGEVIKSIYERYPFLLFKSRTKRLQKKLKKQQAFITSGIVYGDYVPSTIAPCDRKVFESVMGMEGTLHDSRCIHNRTATLSLLKWQEELLGHMENLRNSDRAVLWVVDVPGGAGKSKMCQWLMSSGAFGKTTIFQDMD